MLKPITIPQLLAQFDCNYFLAATETPYDGCFDEMANLDALRYGGEAASARGCLCDGTGSLVPPVLFAVSITGALLPPVLFAMTFTPFRVGFLLKVNIFCFVVSS